jgi:hypothetical protein
MASSHLWLRSGTSKKYADAVEYPEVFDHVGILA